MARRGRAELAAQIYRDQVQEGLLQGRCPCLCGLHLSREVPYLQPEPRAWVPWIIIWTPTLPSTIPRLSLLSRGAEGHRNDCLAVTLQGAGAAGHRADPEDSLWLVNDVENLLCLHHLQLQCPPQ